MVYVYTVKNSDTTSLILAFVMVDSTKFILGASSTNLIGDSFSIMKSASKTSYFKSSILANLVYTDTDDFKSGGYEGFKLLSSASITTITDITSYDSSTETTYGSFTTASSTNVATDIAKLTVVDTSPLYYQDTSFTSVAFYLKHSTYSSISSDSLVGYSTERRLLPKTSGG
jgi:hypothetical protein